MRLNALFLLLAWTMTACGQSGVVENPEGMTIATRFSTPDGFVRTAVEPGSFGAFIRKLHLYPTGKKVNTYKGTQTTMNAAAVLTMDVEQKDLQQCADAAMRIRSEYLFTQKRYDEIAFNFVNGFRFDYNSWKEGKRVKVNGNKTWWINQTARDTSYQNFRSYLTYLYMFAGSASLEKELKAISLEDIQIGDVLIQGGSPGHVVTIVDMAVNAQGKKVVMIAQSYMPAMNVHILNQPGKSKSPWFEVAGTQIDLGYWTFNWQDDLMRYP